MQYVAAFSKESELSQQLCLGTRTNLSCFLGKLFGGKLASTVAAVPHLFEVRQ